MRSICISLAAGSRKGTLDCRARWSACAVRSLSGRVRPRASCSYRRVCSARCRVSSNTCRTYAMTPMAEPGKALPPAGGAIESGIAAAPRTTTSSRRSPLRFTTAAWPGRIPPRGVATTVVTPPLRQVSTFRSSARNSSAACTQGVEPGRSSGPRTLRAAGRAAPGGPPGACGPEADGVAGAMPTSLRASMRPGYTVRPAPSSTMASAGTSTRVPTALIRPLTMTMAPFSIGAPDTVTMRALRMTTGATGCARPTTDPLTKHATPNAARRTGAAIPNGASSQGWIRPPRGSTWGNGDATPGPHRGQAGAASVAGRGGEHDDSGSGVRDPDQRRVTRRPVGGQRAAGQDDRQRAKIGSGPEAGPAADVRAVAPDQRTTEGHANRRDEQSEGDQDEGARHGCCRRSGPASPRAWRRVPAARVGAARRRPPAHDVSRHPTGQVGRAWAAGPVGRCATARTIRVEVTHVAIGAALVR